MPFKVVAFGSFSGKFLSAFGKRARVAPFSPSAALLAGALLFGSASLASADDLPVSSRSVAEKGATGTGRSVAESKRRASGVVERYWKLLLNNPRFGAAFDRVYDEASRSGGIDSLLERVNQTVESSDGEAKGKALTVLALVQIRRNDARGAEKTLRQALEFAPTLPQIPATLGSLLLVSGRLAEGCEVYEEALTLDLNDDERVEILQKLGETYAKLEQKEKADAVWREAIEKYADRDEILSRIAEIQADSGQYRQAAELFAKLETRADARGDVEARVQNAVAAGDMFVRLGERERAIADFERALSLLSPSHWMFKSLRDRLEYVFLLRSDYDGLVEYYQSVVNSRPSDLDAVVRLAIVLGSLGQYDEARKTLDAAMKRAPNDAALVRAAIQLAVAQNRYADADALYDRLDKLGVVNSDDLLARGEIALRNDSLQSDEKRRRAVEYWTRLAENNRENVATAILVADKFVENAFFEEAETALLNLAEQNPDDFEVVKALARFYFERNDDAKAFEALDAYAKTRQNDSDAWAIRAAFLASQNFKSEALGAARQAVAIAPQDFKKRFDLCEIAVDARSDDSLEEDLDALEALARTEDEKNRALNARLRYLQATGRAREYLDSLDAALADETTSPGKRAELLWRKVSCLLFFDDPNGATNATIDALQNDVATPELLRRVPEIIAKSQAPESALELLELAAVKDPANRASYLRSSARVLLELGDADKALETARKALDDDRSSAANYRACADIAVRCGRIDEAIELLREGARLDASDRSATLRLAGLLDESGETEEAARILWRVFDSETRLEDKLATIDVLARYYAKLDRFDELKERLRNDGSDDERRRENACCLARAFTTIRDYESARSTLETAATLLSGRATDDAFLLHSLSSLAELQNDLDAAIRYQEKLCEIDDSREESDRLLTLYRRKGDKEKSRDYLKRNILPRDPLWRQLETVDVLLSVEDYDAASELLEEIERARPQNWETLARKLELAGWTKSKELPALVADALKETGALEEKSSKSLALERDPNARSVTLSGDAWRLGELKTRAVQKLSEPQDYRDLAAQTLAAVYRDRLVLVDKNARSASAALAKPQTPTPSLPNFGAALLLARAWKDRLDNQSARDALAPDGLDAFLDAFESNPENLDSVKLRFAALEYAILLAENLPNAGKNPGATSNAVVPRKDGNEDAARWTRESESLALLVSNNDAAWRAVAWPGVLAALRRENDPEALADDADYLVESLETSLARGALEQDAAIWNFAGSAVQALEEKGLTEQARRARELALQAGKRDYAALLTLDPDASFVPFEDFVASVDSAAEQLVRQLRNRSDVEKARETFGKAFDARLTLETRDAAIWKLEGADPDESSRILASLDKWRLFSDKLSFGRSVLSTFVELNRREIFEGTRAPNNSEAAADELENALYRLLDAAVALDLKLRDAFRSKEGSRLVVAQGLEPAKILGFFKNQKSSVQLSLATYLVDKSLYGSNEPTTILESGKLLEQTLGVLFALDVDEVADSEALPSFKRVDRFAARLEREIAEQDDESLQSYAAKTIELARAVKNQALGQVSPESAEDVAKKAESKLVLRDGADVPGNNPLLVALALLAKRDRRDVDALHFIERVDCVGLSDAKARELAILEAFPDASEESILERKNKAVAFLVGCRLTEEEATKFRALLVAEKRDAEAENLRKRLQSFATRETTINGLLDELLKRVENGIVPDDDDFVFASRVFRVTSATISDPVRLNALRARALAVLAASGRLAQTRERLERLAASSPGACDLLTRLADVQLSLGDADSARRVLASIENKLPNDAGALADYATALARAGEPQKARELLAKAYSRKPTDYFATPVKPDFWTLDDDLAFLKALSPVYVAPNANAVFSKLVEARKNPEFATRADELIESLFNAKDEDPLVAAELRAAAARVFARADDPTLFKYLKEWLLQILEPNENENAAYPDFPDVNRIMTWNENARVTLSLAILALPDPQDDSRELEDLLSRLDKICERYASQKNPNAARQSAALVLRVEVLLRLGRVDDAIAAIRDAEKVESFCGKGLKNDALSLALALDQFAGDDAVSQNGDLLLKYYEKAYDENPHPVYAEFFIARLCQLGLKSSDGEIRDRYRALAKKKLLEIFRLASKADLKSEQRVPGSLETRKSIVAYTDALVSAATDAGESEIVREALDASGVLTRVESVERDATPEWKEYFESLARIKRETNAETEKRRDE